MGYKKLDEVMELLTDELDGFNRSLEKLEKLTKNADHIKIRPDTSEIERLLREHLNSEKANNSKLDEYVRGITEQISSARLVPKVQLWVHYSIWFISLVIIGYLIFKVSGITSVQEKAFAKGEQEVISNLKGYFDQNPKHYQSYKKWIKEKDSVPNQK
ncbi:DUF6730 family protein [Maribacter cobaltidurans]|uniref:Uncharacterized protein n=1 Tax=Maribacter cobaltidurans TaxID=1178778 RepID=A0A223V472_9FLAO|nr:DUF6730 family protein [Maribacter cobaltidurans]ASV29930.1 hypothetical protein CJ263_06670 [Maribacter cobaltidurans]GGD88553.1 hypothetical protein GCM10011412_28080 [Maribacter cobaltidurans]